MDRIDILINPIRIQILQYLSSHETATSSDIITQIPNVSKASIYNHIKILEENSVIEVIQENRIRGTVEKVYCISQEKADGDFNGIISFLLLLLVDFQKYYSKNNKQKDDMLFAGRDYFHLSEEQFTQFLKEYDKLCQKYYDQQDPNEKLRSVSIISSPAIEE